MKILLSFTVLFLLASCTHPDFKKDGGIRIKLEANVGELLKENIQPGDSIANAIINETHKEYFDQKKNFLDLYFSKLSKADPRPAGKHFAANGLTPAASFTECKMYFEKKLATKMDEILPILLKRLNTFGIKGPTVRKGERPEQFIVELPGKNDLQRVRKLLQSSAKLEFWETYDNTEIYDKLYKLNAALAEELYRGKADSIEEKEEPVKLGGTLEEQFAAQKSDAEKQKKEIEGHLKMNPLYSILIPSYSYGGDNRVASLLPGPQVGSALILDTAKVNSYLNMPLAHKIIGKYTRFMWTFNLPDRGNCCGLIAIKTRRGGKAPLSGNIIEDAVRESDEQSGRPQVSITMTQTAGWDWKKLTNDNVGKAIAIVVDGQVYSYPNVMSEISGGRSVISGQFTLKEADDLANLFKAGYLPLSLRIIEEEEVLPSKSK